MFLHLITRKTERERERGREGGRRGERERERERERVRERERMYTLYLIILTVNQLSDPPVHVELFLVHVKSS